MGWHHGALSLLTAENSNGQLAWRIAFRKPPTWDAFPLAEGEALVYEVVLQADAQGQMYPQYEVLRTQETVHGEPLIFLEATPYQQRIFDTEQLQLVPFNEAQSPPAVVRDADSAADPSGSGRADAQQEAALLLSQIRFFNEFPIPSWVRVLFANIMCYPGFDVTHSSTLRTKAAEIKPHTTLSPNGDDLGTVLHEILNRYDFRPAAEELRDFLRVAYPTFEEIHCDTTYGTPPQVLVRVREQGMSRSMEMWELSDGMLRFLCLATALLNPWPRPLVAIDEPELGLHPGLLPIVAEMIKTAAERTPSAGDDAQSRFAQLLRHSRCGCDGEKCRRRKSRMASSCGPQDACANARGYCKRNSGRSASLRRIGGRRMKVWIYVEGRSDVQALSALWSGWQQQLREKGWGIQLIPLENKPNYFRKIGSRATEKLANDTRDLVVGLPDLYPNRDYADTGYKHDNLEELRDVQTRLVKQNLQQAVRRADVGRYIARFYASALKHDLEVLLLAATSQLQSRLKMSNRPSGWRQPPEEQNQDRPPKRIVEELFRRELKRSYKQTTDSYAILRNADLREVAEQCPTFRAMIDWIGGKTGVPGYCLPAGKNKAKGNIA